MDVKMWNGLAAVGAIVDDESVAGLGNAFAFCDLRRSQ